MINLNDVLIQEEYREVRQAEARQHRLIQETLDASPRRNMLTQRVMVRIGDIFIAWGRRLQSRYGDLLSPVDGGQSEPGMFPPKRLAAETSAKSQPCG